jgi:hypothetical protein
VAFFEPLRHDVARPRSVLVHSRLRRPGVTAEGEAAQSMHTFDPKHGKEAGVVSLRPACCSSPESSGCRGPKTRSGTWDPRPPAAAGGRPGSIFRLPEACARARLSQPLRHRRPGVPCRRRPSTLLQASLAEKLVADTLFDSWRGGSRPGISNGRPDGRGASLHVGGEDSPRAGGCSVPGGRTLWPAPCRPLLGRRPPAP